MFACWASKRTLSKQELDTLKKAKTMGLKHREAIVNLYPAQEREFLLNYLTNSIQYDVNPNIKEGLKLYKEYLAEYSYSSPLPKKVA